jgi:hypothetical protein
MTFRGLGCFQTRSGECGSGGFHADLTQMIFCHLGLLARSSVIQATGPGEKVTMITAFSAEEQVFQTASGQTGFEKLPCLSLTHAYIKDSVPYVDLFRSPMHSDNRS